MLLQNITVLIIIGLHVAICFLCLQTTVFEYLDNRRRNVALAFSYYRSEWLRGTMTLCLIADAALVAAIILDLTINNQALALAGSVAL